MDHDDLEADHEDPEREVDDRHAEGQGQVPCAARPAARPHRNSWTRLASRAAPIAISTSTPKNRGSPSRRPGTMIEASIDASAGDRCPRCPAPDGPRTRRSTISDQACASQNTATEMSSDSPISSGRRRRATGPRRGS